jgi:hypothetical protein
MVKDLINISKLLEINKITTDKEVRGLLLRRRVTTTLVIKPFITSKPQFTVLIQK